MQFIKLVCGAALAATASLSSITAFGQGAYLKLGGAYNLGMGYSTNHTSREIRLNRDNTTTINHKHAKVKLGQGWSFNGAAGYMFNKFVGAELGLSYLNKTHGIEGSVYNSFYGISGSINREINAPLLLLQPTLVFTTGGEKFRPFAKFGLVTASVEITEKESIKFWDYREAWESKFSGRRAWGLQGGLGVALKANDQIDFSLGITLNNLTYQPEKWEYTAYRVNGSTVLDEIPLRDRQTNFVETYSETFDADGNSTRSENEPIESAIITIPFNAVSLEFGVKYNF